MTDLPDSLQGQKPYTAQVAAAYAANPGWRYGQAAFNALPVWLQNEVAGTHRDPFHVSSREFVERFIEWAEGRISASPVDTTTDHARDDAFAEGWHRGRDHQSELGRHRAGGAVRVSDSSQPSGERWDKTTGLPVRADSSDSHPEHDDPSRTGREATTNLPAGEGWKSMPIETLLEIGALVKSTIETERARIKRIIEGMELRDDLSRIMLAAIDKERDDV